MLSFYLQKRCRELSESSQEYKIYRILLQDTKQREEEKIKENLPKLEKNKAIARVLGTALGATISEIIKKFCHRFRLIPCMIIIDEIGDCMQNGISVIMPSLNVADYIEECMDSVLSQTLDNMEIICVDAGSTDGTFELLEQYVLKDSRIRLIKSDRKSYGYQMNLGLKAAHGEYIEIVETDDYIAPEMFECLYHIAHQNNVDFVKSSYTSFYGMDGNRFYYNIQNTDTKPVKGVKINLEEQEIYRLADINHIWSGLYNRHFLLDHELWFNETPGASFQDTSFSILVGLVAQSCIYTDDCFYYYRTDRAESSVKSDVKYRCIIDEFDYIDWYLKQHGMYTEENKKMVNAVKLNTYQWNLLRLTEHSRALFRNEISEEMTAFMPDGDLYSCLSEKQKRIVKLLTNPEAVKRLEAEQEVSKQKLWNVLEAGKKGETYIFVGQVGI